MILQLAILSDYIMGRFVICYPFYVYALGTLKKKKKKSDNAIEYININNMYFKHSCQMQTDYFLICWLILYHSFSLRVSVSNYGL